MSCENTVKYSTSTRTVVDSWIRSKTLKYLSFHPCSFCLPTEGHRSLTNRFLYGQNGVCLFACLGFNGTFSTNRLYRAITVGYYITYGLEATQIHNETMKQYNKPRKSCALFGLGFLETIPSPRLGFLRGVFLTNHLASSLLITQPKDQGRCNEN